MSRIGAFIIFCVLVALIAGAMIVIRDYHISKSTIAMARAKEQEAIALQKAHEPEIIMAQGQRSIARAAAYSIGVNSTLVVALAGALFTTLFMALIIMFFLVRRVSTYEESLREHDLNRGIASATK